LNVERLAGDGGYTRMTTLHCVEERSFVALLLRMTMLHRAVREVRGAQPPTAGDGGYTNLAF
jgi:hypothetical protein